MFDNKAIVVGLFSIMMVFSFATTVEAELWDFIIDLNLEKGVIYPGEDLVISGKVVDHAYDGVRGAEVLVKVGADSTKVFTNPYGEFKAKFDNFERIHLRMVVKTY